MTDWQDLNCTCLSKDGKKYDCFGQGTLACSSCIMAWPNRWKSVEPQVMFSVLVWHKEHGWGGMLLRGNGLALRRALRRCQGLSGKIWVIWQIWQQRPYPAESSGSWCRKLLLLPLYTLGPGHLNLLIPPPVHHLNSRTMQLSLEREISFFPFVLTCHLKHHFSFFSLFGQYPMFSTHSSFFISINNSPSCVQAPSRLMMFLCLPIIFIISISEIRSDRSFSVASAVGERQCCWL